MLALNTGGEIGHVKQNVDVRKMLTKTDRAREFDGGRYWRDRCIGPDHPDEHPTMLIFHDGVFCPACGYRADAIQLVREQQGVSFPEALSLLQDPTWKLDPDAEVVRTVRKLDADIATRNHIALLKHPNVMSDLLKYGLSVEQIRERKIGVAEIQVLIEGATKDEDTYETQLRWSIPDFYHETLRQIIYRKSSDTQLGGKTVLEVGAGSHLYNEARLDAADTSTVIVCEGWGDVLTLERYGYLAVASTNGAGHWRSEWNEKLSTFTRGYVVGDADLAGQRLQRRVQAQLPWFKALQLPFAHGSKQDVRDLLRGTTTDEGRRVIRRLMRNADIQAALGGV